MNQTVILRMASAVFALTIAITTSAQTPTPFGTVVEVSRILTEVRVVNFDGNPVLGLGPDDFKVKLAGKPVEVESVLWVPSTADAAKTAPTPFQGGSGAERPTPEGRLIVVLFQVDPGLRPSRTSGLIQMAPLASDFVAKLAPRDRVAVMVFRSHLQLRADFTDDHAAISEMLTTTEILQGRSAPPKPSGPRLSAHFDVDEARDAASIERALELIGFALKPIPGPKSLVLFGYAIGQMTAGPGITNNNDYPRAMQALTAARTSVFALDLTDADYHSLELGLRVVTEDTGGFYTKTNIFPEIAMTKLARVISSYYELSLIPPPDLGDAFSIKVKVDRPRVEVYVRQYHPSDY